MDNRTSSRSDHEEDGDGAASSRSALDAIDDAVASGASTPDENCAADDQRGGDPGDATAAEKGKEEANEPLEDAEERPTYAVELCEADDAPVPPQCNESLDVKDSPLQPPTREGLEEGDDARVEVWSGDEEAPVPPQYLEEKESIDRDIIATKKSAAAKLGRWFSGTPLRSPAPHADVGRLDAGRPRPPPGAASGTSGSFPGTALPQPRPAPGMPAPPEAALPRPSPFVEFYAVEARRVDDAEDDRFGAAGGGRERSERSIYEATFVPSPTWWQRHQRTLFVAAGIVMILVVGAVIAIGIVVSRPDDVPPSSGVDDPAPTTTPSPQPTPTIPPPPPVEGISLIQYLGSFFETDCGDKCWPYVHVSGNTAVVAPLLVKPRTGDPLKDVDWDRQIHILNKTAAGPFETVQRADVEYQPGHMSIFEDSMAVGANWETQQTGAVYVYQRNSTGLWHRVQRIVAPDSAVDAEFGFQVDIYEDAMAIGAYQDRVGKKGSVYIYRHKEDGWTLEQKLAPVDEKIRNFGMAVAIKGSRIAVGDRAFGGTGDEKLDPPGLKKGAVWLYEHNRATQKWTQMNEIMTSDQCSNWFGVSLAFTYDYGLLIGCPRDDMNAGSVYYYAPSETGYEFIQRIVPRQRGPNMMFGDMDQISVYGNALVVGTDTKSADGTVHVFLRNNGVWVEEGMIEPPTEDDLRFGVRVSTSGRNIGVSSWHNSFFYEVVEGPSIIPCITPTSHGAMFDSECEMCDPYVAMDGDTAVITKKKEGLQILSGENMALSDSADHSFKGAAISGDVVVAGTPDANEKKGSASVYQKTSTGNWFEWGPLSPNSIGSREHFGGAVDIDGDLIVVGAHSYLDGRGSAYIFRRSAQWSPWVQEAKLLPNDPNLRGFGRAVRIFNNTVAVADSSYNNSTGAVFVFEYDAVSQSWIQLNETITNSDCGGTFGSALLLTHDDDLLVGCSGKQAGTGAVYYYSRAKNHYILQQRLESRGGTPGDKFGGPDQIAADGDLMVVGTDKEANGTASIFAKKDDCEGKRQLFHK
ncbi:hypothetical protein ACHAXT_006487 [Thalassiosira profunda]